MTRWALAAAGVLVLGACGSDDDSSAASAAPTTLTALVTTMSETTTTAAGNSSGYPVPPTDVATTVATERQVALEDADELLPALQLASTPATNVVELQLRAISVSVDDGRLCVGDVDADIATGGHSCVDTAERHGLVVWSDSNGDPPVYSVLVADDVSVEFRIAPNGEPACYDEAVTKVGALRLWWCEGQFPPVITFALPDGTRLTAVIG